MVYKNKKNIKSALFLSIGKTILSVFFISFFFLNIQTFGAKKRLSFDSMLQNLLNKATKDNLVEKLPTKMQKGDIFSNAFELEENNIKQKNIETIQNTAYYLNTIYTPGCDMDTQDVSILLYQNKDMRSELGNILKIPPMFNTKVFYETYYKSCTKLNKCLTPGKQENFYKDMQMLKRCISDTTTAYLLSKKSNINFATMKQSTKGENIFVDGNEKNGPYDLLIDIEHIGDVLFKGNKDAPETLFFDMPTVQMNKYGDGKPVKPHQNPDGEKLTGDISQDLDNNNGNGDEISENENKEENNKDNTNLIPGVKDLIDGTVDKEKNTKQKNGLSLGNKCISIPTQKDNDLESIEEENIEKKLKEYYENLEEKLEDLKDDVEPLSSDPDLDIVDEESDGTGGDDDKEKIEGDKIPENEQCKSTCEEKDNDWAKEMCQVNCCIQKCKDYFDAPVEEKGVKKILKKGKNETDKIVCISQCLCGEVSGPKKPLDFIGERTPAINYRIKFCRIPVEVLPIVPKKVRSIEEVVDEISIILTKLKESGQLMKHVKTKEMFETSMQNIKFADVLAFNLFIKFKPIFNTMPESQAKQIQKELSEQREQDMRNTKSLEFVDERNKYILMFNPNRRKVKKQVATNYTMQLQNLKDLETKQQRNNKNNNNLVNNISLTTKTRTQSLDNIAKFVENNAKFRNEVTETMNAMNDVARSLKVKVEKSQ